MNFANPLSGSPVVGLALMPLGGVASGTLVEIVTHGLVDLASGQEVDSFDASVSGRNGAPLFWASGTGTIAAGRMTRTWQPNVNGVFGQKVGMLIWAGHGGGQILVQPGPLIMSGGALRYM
jgi:hypothetical protein